LEKIKVDTRKNKEVVDITNKVAKALKTTDLKDGLIHIFVLHTTCSVGLADLDPGTDLDLLDAFEAIMPKLKYRHPHDPNHVTEHILSTMLGASVMIPFKKGELILGTWQRIVLLEFSGPRERELVLTAIPAS
jgi:secondary thiamine-phosphate synthase enzyme